MYSRPKQAKGGGIRTGLAVLQRKLRNSVKPLKKPTYKNAAYPYGAMNFSFPPWQFVPTAVLDGAVTLKGSLNGRFFLKSARLTF
jgi:hypothetical protein